MKITQVVNIFSYDKKKIVFFLTYVSLYKTPGIFHVVVDLFRDAIVYF